MQPSLMAYDWTMTESSFHRRIRLILASLALSIVAGPLPAAERMSAGEWEFSMTTDGETHAVKHCITADEATGFNGDSATGKKYVEDKGKGHCAVKAYDASGNRISYSLNCADRQIDSVTEFAGDSSKGTLTTTDDGKVVTTSVVGRRLGDCK